MSRVSRRLVFGGATSIGNKLPAWESMFAGIVIHGGGVPPSDEALTSEKVDEILQWLESHRGPDAVS